MKRYIVMSMVLVGLLWTSSLLAEGTGPRIEVKEIQHDFGKVVQGIQASYVFSIRNIGNEALVIERVVPS